MAYTRSNPAGQDINDLGATFHLTPPMTANIHMRLDGRLPNDYVKIGETTVDFEHAIGQEKCELV